MPRTLTDAEDQYYQRQDQIANFANAVFENPKVSRRVKQLIKEVYPDVPIPDEDLRTEMEAQFEKLKKEREEKEEKEKLERDRAAWKQNRDDAQKKYNLTEEGLKDLEKFMEEKFVGDYDVAASYKLSKEPKTSEPSWDSTRWHHDKQEGFAEIAKDPEAWGRNEIMGALNRDAERARNGR